MSRRTSLSILLSASVLICATAWSDQGSGDATRGKELYESRCFACHSVEANRVGPMHMGVFGRKAGSIEDYEYTKQVKRSKIVWDEKNLNKWLANPEKVIPGQKMGYQVPDAVDRADIIAYLKTLK